MKQLHSLQEHKHLITKLWMKNVVHVIGGKDSSESDLFTFYMNQYKNIIIDTLYGGKVETFAKIHQFCCSIDFRANGLKNYLMRALEFCLISGTRQPIHLSLI